MFSVFQLSTVITAGPVLARYGLRLFRSFTSFYCFDCFDYSTVISVIPSCFVNVVVLVILNVLVVSVIMFVYRYPGHGGYFFVILVTPVFFGYHSLIIFVTPVV